MDEPLSGVDAARKTEILDLIGVVRARFGASILYVSHDLDEAAALADDLALMENGAVTAFGPAAALFANCDLKALADRADARTILDLPLLERDAGLGLSAYGAQEARLLAPPATVRPGEVVRFQIHARDVTLALAAPTQISVRNLIAAEITAVRLRPDGQVVVGLSTPLGALLSIITQDAAAALALAPGKPVTALVKAAAIR
jgi:molybdate transport system ATP-binding protein